MGNIHTRISAINSFFNFTNAVVAIDSSHHQTIFFQWPTNDVDDEDNLER